MKPVHAVWKDDTIVAIFEKKSSAYKLRNEKRDELPDSCHVRVDKQILYSDLDDRNRLC
jgi:hypothetical protein